MFLKKKKIVFNIPKKKFCLFYDYLPRFDNLIKSNYEKINFRDEINFIVLACSLLFIFQNKFNLKISYINAYILLVRPKVVITFTDNDILFYKLKENNQNIEFISFQNGTRSISGDIFSIVDIKDKLSCDKIFVHNSYVADLYKHYIKSETIISGSLMNNFYTKKNKKKIFDITFISQFDSKRNFNFLNRDKLKIEWDQYYSAEKKILEILKKISIDKDLVINICARFKERNIEEYDFYEKILKKNFTFSISNKKETQYDICDQSELVVFIDSTLGYENISRGNKTVGLSIRGEIINDKSFNFGWPKPMQSNGPSWISYYDHTLIHKIIKYNFDIDSEKWISENFEYVSDLMKIKKNSKLINGILN